MALFGLFGPPNIDKLKAKKDTAKLVKALYHLDLHVRRAAAEALGEIGDANAVGDLVIALSDRIPVVRRASVQALGEIGDANAIDGLVIALDDKFPNVFREAAKALNKLGWRPKDDTQGALYAIALDDWDTIGKLGESAVDTLLMTLTSIEEDIRCQAAQTLGKIGDTRAVDSLVIALNDSERLVQQAAVEALGMIGDPRAVVPLIAKAAHGNGDAYSRAAEEALVNIGAQAVDSLVIALSDNDIRVQLAAVYALGAIGDARAIDPLVKTLSDNDEFVRQVAAQALVQIGSPTINDLPAILYKWILEDKDHDNQQKGIKLLVETGTSQAKDFLINIIDQKKYHNLRHNVISQLAKFKDPSIVKPLIRTLQEDQRNHVQRAAIEVLGDQGDASVISVLVPFLDDYDVGKFVADSSLGDHYEITHEGNWDVAVIALGKLGSEKARPGLEMIIRGRMGLWPGETVWARGELAKAKALLENLDSERSP